jgi:hypothetical protein
MLGLNLPPPPPTSVTALREKMRAYYYFAVVASLFAAIPMFYSFGEIIVTASVGASVRSHNYAGLLAIILIGLCIKLAELRPLAFVLAFVSALAVSYRTIQGFVVSRGASLWLMILAMSLFLVGCGFLLRYRAFNEHSQKE